MPALFHRYGGYRVSGAVCLLALSALVATGAAATATQRPQRKLSLLQQGLNFYRGKTITVIAPGNAGQIIDVTARIETAWMAQYLHATMNIEDVASGATVTGQDDAANANPDGLTIGELSLAGDIGRVLANEPGLNFNPAREEFIFSNGPSSTLLIANPSAPYHSLKDLEHTAQPPPVLMLTSGVSDNEFAALFGALGYHFKYVTAYPDLGNLLQGFIRGDGPLVFAALSGTGPIIAQGKGVPLFVNVVPSIGTTYRQFTLGLPTLAALFAQHPARTARQRDLYAAVIGLFDLGDPLVLQTAVSTDKLVAMRAAGAWAAKQAGFKAAMLAAGLNPSSVDPVAAKQAYVTLLKNGSLLLPFFDQVNG